MQAGYLSDGNEAEVMLRWQAIDMRRGASHLLAVRLAPRPWQTNRARSTSRLHRQHERRSGMGMLELIGGWGWTGGQRILSPRRECASSTAVPPTPSARLGRCH